MVTIIKVRENLELRTLIPDNAAEVFEVCDKNREYLRKWLPWIDGTKSPESVRETIEKWQKSLDEKKELVCGVFLDGKYVGNMGMHDINRFDVRDAEIGYWIDADYQGRGIITDCVRAFTDYAFNEIDLNRIYICCAVENDKSRAVPERLGFVFEGKMQDGVNLHGVYHDKLMFGMLKRNWK